LKTKRKDPLFVKSIISIILIGLLLITCLIAGCIYHATGTPPKVPSVQTQPTTTLATFQSVPVPPEYQSMYSNLKSDMDQYDAILASRDTGTSYPVIFGAELLPANINRGDVLLQPSVLESVNLTLDRYQGMGIQGVTIPIHYPIYTPDYPRYKEYVAFYKQVADDVHQRGMKLVVENAILFANTPYSPVTWDYSRVSFDQYKSIKKQMVESIIQDIQPDYLDIGAEPDTEYELTGWKELKDPAKYTEMVSFVLKDLDRKTTKVGAGVGTWESTDYAQRYAADTNLDFISLHVYPVYGSCLNKIDTVTGIANKYNKSVIMDETWLYKQDSPKGTGMAQTLEAYGMDIFSFWSPLDRQFLGTMTRAARQENIEYISPFWSTYFFGYVDYTPATDVMNFSDRMNTVNRVASGNILTRQLTPTGQYYKDLIRNNT